MTRDDIKKLMAAAGAAPGDRVPIGYDAAIDLFEKFAALVAAAEREECAKVCDEFAGKHGADEFWAHQNAARECAIMVRARSQSGDKP